jgi:GxxExxY protein
LKVEKKKYRELTYKIIGVYYEVYNELGHGFLESVYQKSLGVALKSAGLEACWPIAIPSPSAVNRSATSKRIFWSRSVCCWNLKATRALDRSHVAQLRNYLRGTDIECGLLLNFGLTAEFRRLLFSNAGKLMR